VFTVAGGNSDRITFLGNAGESPNNTNPFYDLTGSIQGCIFIGGFCTCGDNTNGTWIRFGTNAYNNQVIGSFDPTGQTGWKAKLVMNNTSNRNTWWHPNHGVPLAYKSGAGPSFSDADFVEPQNGIMGIAHNTTGPADALWVRSNGAWKSVALT
jgi:hypothetical protein